MRVSRTFVAAAVAGTVLDLATKAAAFHYLRNRGAIDVVDGVFSLAYSENRGAAFGILEGQRYLFFIISVVACALLVQFSRGTPDASRAYHAALGGILAGVAGNFYDRVVHGIVRDFIDVYAGWSPTVETWFRERFGTHHWPTFNLADAYIVVGAIFLIIASFARGSGSRAPADAAPKEPKEAPAGPVGPRAEEGAS